MPKLAIVLLSVLYFSAGWVWRGDRADAELNQLLLKTAEDKNAVLIKLNSYQEKLDSELKRNSEINALLKKARDEKNSAIQKEVIRYAEKSGSDNSCVLPMRWVQLHNTAARNSMQLSDAGSGTNATAANTANALEVVTDNYMTCNAIRDQLIQLQQHIRAVQGE